MQLIYFQIRQIAFFLTIHYILDNILTHVRYMYEG